MRVTGTSPARLGTRVAAAIRDTIRSNRNTQRWQAANAQPRVSIIIPVYNNLGYTRACLKALHRTISKLSHELIVVDNGSTDGTSEYLSTLRGVRSLRNNRNLGFAHACNQGAAAASADFLVFLNNDTIPRRGWLTALLDVAASDASIGIAGSKLLYPDGRIQHAGMAVNPEECPVPFHIYRYERANAPHVNKQREFQAVTGACMLVRKTAFLELGGFDEIYLNSCEDADLCFRARERGYRVVYVPRSVVTHFESKTPGRFSRESENLKLFRARWKGRVFPDFYQYVEADGKERWVFHVRDALYEARLLYIQGKTAEGDAVWDAVCDRLPVTLIGMNARFPSRRDFNLPGLDFADMMLAMLAALPGTHSWVPMRRDFQTHLLAVSAAALYAFAENHSAARYFLLRASLHRPANLLKPQLALLTLKTLLPVALTRNARRILRRLRHRNESTQQFKSKVPHRAEAEESAAGNMMTPALTYAPLKPSATYSPWADDVEFTRVYALLVGKYTLVDVYRSYELWTLVEQVLRLPGDILEIGTWRGGTGCLMAKRVQLLKSPATVFLCDTFAGVVKAGERDPHYRGGEHADASIETVRQLAAHLGLNNIDILEGIFPDDTGCRVASRQFSLCHIDVDVYQSARDALEWVWPRLSVGGVVVFDDYGWARCEGITRLVNERAGTPGSITLYNLNGHAVVIKTGIVPVVAGRHLTLTVNSAVESSVSTA